MAISISSRQRPPQLPVRAFRPYAVDPVERRERFDTERASASSRSRGDDSFSHISFGWHVESIAGGVRISLLSSDQSRSNVFLASRSASLDVIPWRAPGQSTLQRNLRSVDFGSVLRDVMTIADEVDSQLEQSILSYVDDQSRTTEQFDR